MWGCVCVVKLKLSHFENGCDLTLVHVFYVRIETCVLLSSHRNIFGQLQKDTAEMLAGLWRCDMTSHLFSKWNKVYGLQHWSLVNYNTSLNKSTSHCFQFYFILTNDP